MEDSLQLLDFPEDVLFKILEYCDVQTLGRLGKTCREFRRLLNTEDACWLNKSNFAVGSNMSSPFMKKKCRPYLSAIKRCEISKKWKTGICAKTNIARCVRCMPWILLDQNYLFCTKEKSLVRYFRKDDGNIDKNSYVSMIPHTDDVSKFVVNGNEIVTAARNGMLGRWNIFDFQRVHCLDAHSCAIYSVDAKKDVIITGSRDETVKIWKALPNDTECVKELNMSVRVLSVAIMPTSSHFIVGLPGTNEENPLQLFDLERSKFLLNFGDNFKRGAGILDIYPESDQIFLCCGYDGTVKLWDVRTPQNFVSSWTDPYDNGMYCVKSDHNITIVSGANRHGYIYLWDKRVPKCQRLFQFRGLSSPVYSIDFDAAHLFAAYDRNIVQFSFI